MDTSHVYEIRVEGQLSDRWSIWFDGMSVQSDMCGETTLKGQLADQAALFSVLTKMHNLNLILISILRLPNTNDLSDTKPLASFDGPLALE